MGFCYFQSIGSKYFNFRCVIKLIIHQYTAQVVVVVVVVLPRRVFVEGPAAAGHRPARAATLDPRGVSDKRKILEQAPVEEKEKRWPEEEPEKR